MQEFTDLDAAHVRQGRSMVLERMEKAMQQAGRDDFLTLIAVSKLHPVEAIRAAAMDGQQDFGENYVQEALGKQESWQSDAALPPVRWHFTGHIQSRKARDVVGRFNLIHTVDSQKLAGLLERHASEKGIRQAVLIQVNVGNEAQKAGVGASELPVLAEYVASCPHLDLQGLMCLPPIFDAGLEARPHFALLYALREKLRQQLRLTLPHLSMGMSGDLEAAVLEGATMVRVGTDIFGERPRLT